MKSKFPIETFNFLRKRKLEQLKRIRNERLYLRTVYTLTGPTINLNFDLVKCMTYEEAVDYFNKADLNVIDNNYKKTEINKSELERLNTIFKYLIEENNIKKLN